MYLTIRQQGNIYEGNNVIRLCPSKVSLLVYECSQHLQVVLFVHHGAVLFHKVLDTANLVLLCDPSLCSLIWRLCNRPRCGDSPPPGCTSVCILTLQHITYMSVTQSYSHTVTQSYHQTVTQLFSHTVIRSYSHTNIQSHSHTVTESYSYTITQSHSHTVTLPLL